MNIQGGCHCGAIRFEVKREPDSVCTCYCDTCKKISGSTSMTAADFKKEDLVLLKGNLQSYQSSLKVVRSFCGKCGSHISYVSSDFPDQIEVFIGTFDDPEAFPTELHTWTSQKPAWVGICDDLPQHLED